MLKYKKTSKLSDHKQSHPKLKLQVRNFGEQSRVSVGEIVALLDRLPAHHLGQLKEIIYDPRRIILQLIDDPMLDLNRNSKGMFIQNRRTIAIFDFDDKTQLFDILMHELAHHVYYVIIDSTVKKRWVTEVCREAPFITPYASRNASEDFAESYAKFVLEPEKLRNIPIKYNFILREIFKGVSPNRDSLDVTF